MGSSSNPHSLAAITVGDKVACLIDNQPMQFGEVVEVDEGFYIVKLDREYLDRYYYRLARSEIKRVSGV